MKKYYSFDVFNTLVTRNVGMPHHIFLIVADKASKWKDFDLDARIYAAERINAEKELLEKGEFPGLHEIFKNLEVILGISPDLSNRLLELELEIEKENLVPVKKMVDELNRYRNAGHQIIYISDMYLNEKYIRDILKGLNILRDGEKVYVSCEYGINKTSGALFEKVIADLDINPAQLHHTGNSKTSDFNGAKKVDINCSWFKEGDLNRYEKLLSTKPSKSPLTTEDILFYSRMAASSRLARLENEKYNKQIYDVASSVAGPLLFTFVTFLLEKSEGKTLYFLSRDGYILYKIAERIASEKGLDVKINYLFISREVLLLSKLKDKPGPELVESILKIYSHKTTRDLLNRLSVPQQTIEASSIEPSVLDKEMRELSAETLTSILHDDTIFKDISSEVNKRSTLLHAYLESEGLFDEDKVVLVDVGWNLTIQDMIAEIFNEKGISPPEGIYFGINNANSSILNGKKTGYLWDLRKNGFTLDIPKKTRIIEVFCSAPQGQTVDYENINGDIVPVFNGFEKKYLLTWGILGMEKAILSFTNKMLKQDTKIKSRHFDKNVCRGLIELFWLSPTVDEIKKWGSYPFFASADSDKVINLFEKKPFHQILYHIIRKNGLPRGEHDSWPDAHFYTLKPYQRQIAKMALIFSKYVDFSTIRKLIKK